MEYAAFRAVAARWVAEKVIPSIVPEGPMRWVASFAALAKVGSFIDANSSLLPMDGGRVDMAALRASLDGAFAVQQTLALEIPSIPAFAAMGVGPSTLRFTKADAESFLSYADGAGTTVSVDL